MKWKQARPTALGLALLMLVAGTATAQHNPSEVGVIDGFSGTDFTFSAEEGYISAAVSTSVYVWGYGNVTPSPSIPGAVLIGVDIEPVSDGTAPGADPFDLNIDIPTDHDGDGVFELDGFAELNIDTDGDGFADLNVDSNGDSTADFNIDSDGDGIADVNLDADLNGVVDLKGNMQYPGPTLIVNQGDTVTITLHHNLSNHPTEPVSIVFPGQTNVMVSGGDPTGLLTHEALPGNPVTYSFVAGAAGTYTYHSGTNMDKQVQMGLVGALIVRPTSFNSGAPWAYGHKDSAYDAEYLFLLTEMDLKFHRAMELGLPVTHPDLDTAALFNTQWYINGRSAPDTMFPPYSVWLPNQPYNVVPCMYPGERVLMRVIGAGRDSHPFHHHGNHARIIAKDGRMLSTSPSFFGANLSHKVFTIKSIPGQTVDAIFTWTGEGMGWDIYGHDPTDPMEPEEYAPDHGKPLPVLLPEGLDVAFGGFWSGSPFLGNDGGLPPGEGGLNPGMGFTYVWHSHNEKELANNDLFPGGMLTVLVVLPPGVKKEESPYGTPGLIKF